VLYGEQKLNELDAVRQRYKSLYEF
jgi:alpha-tubulin suppressor-like RCC1 family protein